MNIPPGSTISFGKPHQIESEALRALGIDTTGYAVEEWVEAGEVPPDERRAMLVAHHPDTIAALDNAIRRLGAAFNSCAVTMQEMCRIHDRIRRLIRASLPSRHHMRHRSPKRRRLRK